MGCDSAVSRPKLRFSMQPLIPRVTMHEDCMIMPIVISLAAVVVVPASVSAGKEWRHQPPARESSRIACLSSPYWLTPHEAEWALLYSRLGVGMFTRMQGQRFGPSQSKTSGHARYEDDGRYSVATSGTGPNPPSRNRLAEPGLGCQCG